LYVGLDEGKGEYEADELDDPNEGIPRGIKWVLRPRRRRVVSFGESGRVGGGWFSLAVLG